MQTPWIPTPSTPDRPFSEYLAQDTVAVLAGHGLLTCAGPDSARFLQGQLTCNLQDILPTQARPGAHCTPKGRMVATFLLAHSGDQAYSFRTRLGILPVLQAALAKYIVFSKASLQDSSGDWLLLGLQGSGVAQRLSQVFGTVPDTPWGQASTAQGLVIRLGSVIPRYECWVPSGQAQGVWEALQPMMQLPCSFWDWLDIHDGIGSVLPETREAFIPQMLNLADTGGISFTKGCYTGQEIVARAQYRGAVKKSMHRFAGQGEPPTPGTALLAASGQAVGEWVLAVPTGPMEWEGLAVVQHEHQDERLASAAGQPLVRLPLPYEPERA